MQFKEDQKTTKKKKQYVQTLKGKKKQYVHIYIHNYYAKLELKEKQTVF